MFLSIREFTPNPQSEARCKQAPFKNICGNREVGMKESKGKIVVAARNAKRHLENSLTEAQKSEKVV